MPLQWRNKIWQSLEEGAGKRCSECDSANDFGRHPGPDTESLTQTPNIAFRHLPPNSARFGYATEGALFISAQLSNDAVSALPKGLGINMTVEAT